MDWFNLMKGQGVIWQYNGEGPHASYSLSNRHSDFYFNSNYLIANPSLLKAVCLALLEKLKPSLGENPDWVITYPPYGLNVGFCLAELLECKFAYVKSLEKPNLEFDIGPRDNVLFCADDLYSGGSFRTVKNALFKKGLEIMEPLVVVANFSGQTVFDGYQVESLIDSPISSWAAEDCPLCGAGSPAVSARSDWVILTREGGHERKG
jgi:orotate phosphoribosyltransferase